MAQQIYVNLGGKKKSRSTKILIILGCVALAIIIALAAIGIIVNSDGDKHLEVSQAIAENVQLKQEIDALKGEVERLNGEVERLGGELAARPTPEPEATASPMPGGAISPSASPEAVSPRGYYD